VSWLRMDPGAETAEGLSVEVPEGPMHNGEPLFREMERVVRETRVQVTLENLGAIAAHFGWLVDYSREDGHRVNPDRLPRLRKPEEKGAYARVGDWLREDGRKVYDHEVGTDWVRAGTWRKAEGPL
jgi:hypothetical protein